MTRRTPGHERILTEDPQLRSLSAVLVAALDPPADDVLAPADPAPARLVALRSVTALRDRSPDVDSDTDGDTPVPGHPMTDVPNPEKTDIEVRFEVLSAADPAVADLAAADLTAADPTAVDAVAELWSHRGGPRDRAVRDLLVRHYGSLVRAVAARMAVGLPASVEAADLVQAGVFGLLDAIARFEPTRGVRFESYAAQRIRGAMLDELRAQDWVPRSVRSRIREIERARERLERLLGRSPDRREIAVELGIPLRDLIRVAHHRRLVSVEAFAETTTVESVVDEAAPDPAAAFDLRETYRELVEAIARLDERDRLVVQLYYVENRTLAEIGTLLGVTESRVCQLHSRVVVRLRGRLAEPVAG